MTLVVGSHIIQSFSSFSAPTQQILQMTVDGPAWIQWAIAEKKSPYSFLNETDLVEGVQMGLHGTNLLLLTRNQLLISPRKLAELSADDINTLAVVELEASPSDQQKQAADAVLSANALLSQNDLQDGLDFLENLGVSDNSLFKAMYLQERIGITSLYQWEFPLNGDLNTEAAAYAVGISQSPLEFIDYFQFYTTLIARQDPELDQSSREHQNTVTSYLQDLKPLLRNQLRAAILEEPLSPLLLQQYLKKWSTDGNQLGFSRFSAAANQVLQGTQIGLSDTQSLSDLVQTYFQKARAFMDSIPASSTGMSQDGLSQTYELTGQGQTGRLFWRDDCVVIKTFFDDSLIPPRPQDDEDTTSTAPQTEEVSPQASKPANATRTPKAKSRSTSRAASQKPKAKEE